MIGGENAQTGSGGFVLLTGLGAVELLMANPSNEEYEEITGSKLPFDLKYEKSESISGGMQRPIRILYRDVEHGQHGFIDIYLGDQPITTKDGSKFKFIDNLGRISYYLDDIDNISSKFTFNRKACRKLFQGEDVLYTLIQTLARYDSRSEDANFMADIKNAKSSYQHLFAGDLSGLNKLLDHYNDGEHGVGMLFTVREKETDGKTKYYQKICTNTDTFFTVFSFPDTGLSLHSKATTVLKQRIQEGERTGYSITKEYYTVDLQHFQKENCLNYENAPSDSLDTGGDFDFDTGDLDGDMMTDIDTELF